MLPENRSPLLFVFSFLFIAPLLPSSRCKPMIWTNLGILCFSSLSAVVFTTTCTEYHQSHVEYSWCSGPALSRYPIEILGLNSVSQAFTLVELQPYQGVGSLSRGGECSGTFFSETASIPGA